MATMQNYTVLIKPDELPTDILQEICEEAEVGPDEHFAFSAIFAKDKLKINSLLAQKNPYTPRDIVRTLWLDDSAHHPEAHKGVRYIQPPLEDWLTEFRPALLSMVENAYPRYVKMYQDRDEMLSILYLCVVELYNKGYYLNKGVIYRTFINRLNMGIRKSKHFQDAVSLDAPFTQSADDGEPLCYGDIILDQKATDEAQRQMHYTIDDYWEDMFEKIKSLMLQEMSQLSFDRILVQLQSKTVDANTSRILAKYRKIFGGKNK